MTVFCPCCGLVPKDSRLDLEQVCPGRVEWQCPACKTLFSIQIEFWEKDDEEMKKEEK